MTQKDKELLLKDLCARLPYGVKVECKWKTPAPNGTYGMICTLDSFLLDQIYNTDDIDVPFDEYKPYLFPLSSMTEEQHTDMFNYYHNAEIEEVYANGDYLKAAYIGDDKKYEWLNRNHFDYRGLIEKGLALDATGLGIY